MKVASRNFLRNKRRTIINVLGITVGLCAILLVGGYYEFNYQGLRESMIRSQYAHIQLYKTGFLDEEEVDPYTLTIEDSEEIVRVLEKDKRVSVVASRVKLWGLLANDKGEKKTVRIHGVQPDRESLINLYITKRMGAELSSKSTYEMELGAFLAEDLGLEVDDSALVNLIDSEGFQNAASFKVRGVTGSFSEGFDQILVRLPLPILQELAYISGVQEIVVLLNDTDMTYEYMKDVKQVIKEKGWDLEVTSWSDHAGYYHQVVQYYQGFFIIIITIVCIVAFLTTLNTMLMSTLERISEVGTMRSFGTPTGKIVFMFFQEGFLYGLISFILAIIVTMGIKWGIDLNGGFVIPAPPGISSSIQATVVITSQNIILAACIGFFVPVFSTVFTVSKIKKIEIIDQLRYNNNT